MTARRLAAAALVLVPRLAAAEPQPHRVLVMQSEGRADAGLRAKIDAAITRLAIAAQLQASAGELTFTDAATAVGCRPDAASCKDEVIGMLSVDEIVLATVTPKPGGVEIAVRRIARGAPARDAAMLLPTGAPPGKLDPIAPLFSEPRDAPAPLPEPGPAIPPPTSVALASPAVPETAPAGSTTLADQPTARDARLELAGMIGGGSMLVLGMVLWGAASSTQDEINGAPTRTPQDLTHLKDLESRGDLYAAGGNVLVVTGAVLGGIATYLYIRDRRAAGAQTARLVPTVLDHGAGLVLTLGGMP
jgi:hypothetical protein